MFSLASALLIGTALSLTACSSEDNIVNNIQQPAQNEVHTYHVCIPASFGDDAQTRAVDFSGTTAIASFATTDKIYVYRKSPTTAWLSWNSGTSSLDYLSPSQDGASCNLTGNITGQFAEGDVLELYYNMNLLGFNGDPSDPTTCEFDYGSQDGSASGVADFAVARVKVKSIAGGNITFCQTDNETDETARFENLSSMFRFKFTDGTNPISVKRLKISSTNNTIAIGYLPMLLSGYYVTTSVGGPITVNLPTANTDYIYMGMGIASTADTEMDFYVETLDRKVYTATKAAPAGGFIKGKYYYSTSPIALTYTEAAPTITWPSTTVDANTSNIYAFNAPGAPNTYDITIANASGKNFCSGYAFMISSTGANGTVRLNNLNAAWSSTDVTTPFISVSNGDLTVELTGSNSITSNTYYGIHGGGNVKFSCTGTSAKLTVTTTWADFCGIYGDSNYRTNDADYRYNNYLTTTELDVTSQLSADPSVYTVTRSARTDNGDGTYSWTYTVTN